MKFKWIAMLLIGISLLAIAQYLLLPSWYSELGIKASGWLILLSVAAAITISIWLIHWMIKKLTSATLHGNRISLYLGGYIVYPFALFLGFVVGGNFGGAIGDNALGDVGAIVGIGVGIFIVIIVVCSIGALLGYLLGGLAQRLVSKNRAD